MNPALIKVQNVEMWLQMVDTRMPFRYGSAKLVRCPHLYFVATLSDSHGRSARGIAADNLPPKWFDKRADKSYAEEVADQLQVARWAARAAQDHAPATPFALWLDVYQQTQQQASAADLPPLLGGFGPSLLERAVNDAVGHLLDLPFHQMLRDNILGVELGRLEPSLQGIQPRDVLPAQPLNSIAARHTVGLSDPIRTLDIPDEERLHDGLPQSLEEVVAFYGVRYFKIKISNRLDEDIARLGSIAALLDHQLPGAAYFCTLDGNEQYETFEQLLPLLAMLRERPELHRLAASIVFIEQPLARSFALDPNRCAGIENVTSQFPLIIDEADDSLDAYRRALRLGYSGTSHKNCKNTFKSVLNLARSHQASSQSGQPFMLSAEDLTNIAPIALGQDLTALSTLGIAHAERNGHHYFRGLSHLSQADQERALQAHPGLLCRGEGSVRLNIAAGRIDCGSLHRSSGLGVEVWPDGESCTPLERFDLGALEM